MNFRRTLGEGEGDLGKKLTKRLYHTRSLKPAIASNRESGIIIIFSVFMSLFDIFYILFAFFYIPFAFPDILIKFFNRIFDTLHQRHHVDSDVILLIPHTKPTLPTLQQPGTTSSSYQQFPIDMIIKNIMLHRKPHMVSCIKVNIYD